MLTYSSKDFWAVASTSARYSTTVTLPSSAADVHYRLAKDTLLYSCAMRQSLQRNTHWGHWVTLLLKIKTSQDAPFSNLSIFIHRGCPRSSCKSSNDKQYIASFKRAQKFRMKNETLHSSQIMKIRYKFHMISGKSIKHKFSYFTDFLLATQKSGMSSSRNRRTRTSLD